MKILCFITIGLFFYSCSNQEIKKSYFGKRTDGTGRVATEISYVNNHIEGMCKYYYSNGNKKLLVKISNGIGFGYEFDVNGDTIIKSTYTVITHFGSEGIKKNGWAFEYEKDHLKSICTYKDGYKHGLCINYSEKKKVLSRGVYIFGAKNGLWIEGNDSLIYNEGKQMFIIKNAHICAVHLPQSSHTAAYEKGK